RRPPGTVRASARPQSLAAAPDRFPAAEDARNHELLRRHRRAPRDRLRPGSERGTRSRAAALRGPAMSVTSNGGERATGASAYRDPSGAVVPREVRMVHVSELQRNLALRVDACVI